MAQESQSGQCLRRGGSGMSGYTMIVLTLEITVIALLLVVLAVIYVFRKAARAPKGFENSDGFHFGTEPPAHGKARRRRRAVAPVAVNVNDSTMPVQIHHIPPAQAAL